MIQEHLPALRRFADALQKTAARGDLEHLAELLQQRQLLFEQWHAGERALSEMGREALQSASREMQAALEELIAQEENLIAFLTTWRAALQDRLKGLGTGQQLLKGYGPPGLPRPRFIDSRR